ncbi:MAG: hypothetical protein AAFU79_20725 [Myxococcota bacterium]
MRSREAIATLFIVGAASACDPRLVLRPVELDIQGLSASVQTLVVAVDSPDPGCGGLSASTALDRQPLQQQTWTRGQMTDRSLEIEAVSEMEVMIWAVGRNSDDVPIQFGCDRFAFEDVEVPERTLVLRMQP